MTWTDGKMVAGPLSHALRINFSSLSSMRVRTKLVRLLLVVPIVLLYVLYLYTPRGRLSGPEPISHGPPRLVLNSATSLLPTQKPTAGTSPIAKIHWQTSSGTIDTLLDEQREALASWRQLNPDFRYELLSNGNFETFVTETYSKNPDIVRAFTMITDSIVRSDFVRYLALFAYGGVYSDLDTVARKPVSAWIPPEYVDKVRLVIGIEIDEAEILQSDWTDSFQFCQSTLMASAGHGMLKILISNIMDRIHAMEAEHGSDLGSLRFSYKDVLRIAGPPAFSDAVFQYLSEKEGRNVTRNDFVGLTSAKLMADVLVLTTNGFAPGQTHSRSGLPTDSTALVHHLFRGTWKGSHDLADD